MDQSFMKKREIWGLVLTMSIPNVLSMLVNSLYNIVDSFFVAQISEDAMTALSLVFPIQNLINSIAIGFGVGVNAVIALHLGAKKDESANISATYGVILSALHGILLTIISILIMPWFLGLFTDNAQVIEMGVEYSRVVFMFSLPISVSMSLELF